MTQKDRHDQERTARPTHHTPGMMTAGMGEPTRCRAISPPVPASLLPKLANGYNRGNEVRRCEKDGLMRSTLWAVITTAVAVTSLSTTASATPPFGDPNQPYDRLPGTLQTPHVKWARPLAGGPVKGLFILPYGDSREVVEIAQRLELD